MHVNVEAAIKPIPKQSGVHISTMRKIIHLGRVWQERGSSLYYKRGLKVLLEQQPMES